MKMKNLTMVLLLACFVGFYPYLVSGAFAVEKDSAVNAHTKSGINALKKDLSAQIAKGTVDEAYGKLPLYFIKNNGQMDKKVKFYTRNGGHTIFFTEGGIYFSLIQTQKLQESSGDTETSKTSAVKSEILKLSFFNAKKESRITAGDLQKGVFNYFIGNDPAKWRTDIPTYGALVYEEIYKDIDIKFYGNNRRLEYDVIVKPGGDPKSVKLFYEGTKGLNVNTLGELEIALGNGTLTQKTPYLYQEIDGKKVPVKGAFKLIDRTSFGFEVASYDKKLPLIIDPVIEYSRYIGGDYYERIHAIDIDNAGNAYITGYTDSPNFRGMTHDPQQYYNDMFVAKLNPEGAFLYCTVLGGRGYDQGSALKYRERGESIAVDSAGNAHITGVVPSCASCDNPAYNWPHFPTTATAFQDTHSDGYADAFYAVISSSGGLLYSSFLGGDSINYGYGIAVDTDDNAYITGQTWSTDLPTTSSVIQPDISGGSDTFVLKINFDPTDIASTSVAFLTYLGGSSSDAGNDIAVDSSRNVYITGETSSTDFPGVSTSSIQPDKNGASDAFVIKLNTSGTSIAYSTYIGSVFADYGLAIAVDNAESAYITGYININSEDPPDVVPHGFPLLNPIQDQLFGWAEAFATKINPAGDELVYSSFLGGSGYDIGRSIAVDSSQTVYVTGGTGSADFPIVSPIDGHDEILKRDEGYHVGDAFITRINAAGDNFLYSTFFGGDGTSTTGSDIATGIAVDNDGNAYVAGYSNSSCFPAVPIEPDFEPRCQAKPSTYPLWDLFVAKISDSGTSPSEPEISVSPMAHDFDNIAVGNASTHQVTINNFGTEALDISGISMVTGADYSVAAGGTNACGSLSPTIAASGSCTVEVTFSPQSVTNNITDMLRITSNDADEQTVDVSFTGDGTSVAAPEIDVSPMELNFNDVVVNSPSSPLQVIISNTGESDLIISEIFMESDLSTDTDGYGFSVETGSGLNACSSLSPTIAGGSGCSVEVTFTPLEVANGITDNLIIYSNDFDESSLQVLLTGNGTAGPSPNISVSPLIIDFGEVVEGEASDLMEITISSIGSEALNVLHMDLTNPQIFILDVNGGSNPCTVSNPVIAVGENCTVGVTFMPSVVEDDLVDMLTITLDHPDEPSASVTLSGNGVAAPVGNSPPLSPKLVFPPDEKQDLKTDLTFEWQPATDPDGDPVSYDLYYCEDSDPFNNCTSVEVASLKEKVGEILHAGFFSYGRGLILFGVVFAAGFRNRNEMAFLSAMIILTGTLVIACGNNNDHDKIIGNVGTIPNTNITHTATGLSAGTIYYWGVASKDNDGGETHSAVFEFTTE